MSSSTSSDFHLCALCGHCLVEPITLTCGCSFCKACLLEYNAWSSGRLSALRLSTSIDSDVEQQNLNVASSSTSANTSRVSTKRKLHTLANERALANGAIDGQHHTPVRCYTCARAHEHNSPEYLKTNVLVSKLVDRMWRHNVEIRRVRSDVRAYVCFCLDEPSELFDINKFEYLLNSAYTLGKLTLKYTHYLPTGCSLLNIRMRQRNYN